MQQVGPRSSIQTALLTDPAMLPAAVRQSGRHALINAGHVWLLHRRLIVRIIVALICAGLFGTAIHYRAGLQAAAMRVADAASSQMALAGFAVTEIAITGQSLTADQAIVNALSVGEHTSILGFDAEQARARVEALPAVKSATVRKIYPGRLVVHVVEQKPVARWRVDGVTYLIDDKGAQIARAAAADDKLPLVIGDGAATNAMAFIRELDRYPTLNEGLLALSRIADRRWDLIYRTGLRVQLPEAGVAGALRHLADYQKKYQLLDRDLVLIDLRVDGIVAVRETKRDKEGRPLEPETAK